ncbi:MAG: NrfD/PsrC family molybdoenzyme membrane anchor subunit [Caldimicrobium sp.]|nr:polysulfide reductase NrfD [Caldimicrobium sp.]MDW8094685.1 NrfD/PsrC family molybdoenzyme membrane anchor subunit [Caldimicrobium sp.]
MTFLGIELPTKEEFKNTIGDIVRGKGGFLLYLSLLGLILGLISVARIFILGHGETVNTNAQVPWGLQIVTYIYLVLISTGCTFANFFGMILNQKNYLPLAPKVVFFAILTAIGGMFGLATELGHTERLYMWFLSPQPKSPMWWMSVWYTLELAVLIYFFIELKRGHASANHAWIVFIVAIITHSTLGALLGVVEQRFYFYSALMPIYFLVFAYTTGVAASAIIAAVEAPKLGRAGENLVEFFRKMLLVGLGLALLLGFWRIVVGVYGQIQGAEVFELTLGSQIVYGLVLGTIIPLILLYYYKGPKALILISLFIMIIQFKTRYDLVVGGFKVPVWRAYTIPEYVQYTPSIDEILIFIGGTSLALFLYLFADKLNFLTFKDKT